MTISIGCAQLGSLYGIANKTGKLRQTEFVKILKELDCKKSVIDTSINYGSSEIVIGKSLKKIRKIKKFKIITKLPKLSNINTKDIKYKIFSNVKKSLKRMSINNLYGILIHDINDIKSNKKKIIYESLQNLKKDGYVKKIGFSAYDIKDVKKIINSFEFDILQFPFNIFDQRLLNKKLLKNLKDKKIEIHIRSIFLQGLLLMNKKEIPDNFLKKYNQIIKWYKFLDKNKISNLRASIEFIKKFNFYSNIIIGFDNYLHFKEVKKIFKKKKIKLNFQKFRDNSSLIHPQKWKTI
ncbi:aldo/keto reductase [Candidatus Pelagibacter sp.]|uniref:aldo/keto reductase n=1 Tax=Candidatus Pelagibacter sp. TaxID=2024849 RepID=UPI003F86D9AF